MRLITAISLLFIFTTSCSTRKGSDKQSVSIEPEIAIDLSVEETEPSLCDTLNVTARLEGKRIELRLSEEDIKDREFQAVDDAFYTNYIEHNENFRKRSDSYEKGGVGTKHFYYGLTNHMGSCLILVYEYFILNHSEDKLFLLTFDSVGQLTATLQVAGLTTFPGGQQRTYSYLEQTKLRLISVTDEILGPYNEETNTYQYIMDSSITDYNVENWSQIEIVESDSIKGLEYWK
jgi:hypothetical protein